MADRLDLRVTKATAAEVGAALALGWWHLWHQIPERWSILLLLAQSALETGQWAKMVCYSLGGVKSREGDGHDYTFFPTTECLTASAAQAMIKKAGQRTDAGGPNAEIVGTCTSGLVKVKLYPDNPGSRFRAYTTLELAAIDHLSLLATHKAFKAAWPAVLSGSPESFARLLKEARYYSAPVEQYTASVKSYFKTYSSLQLEPSAIIESAREQWIKAQQDKAARDEVDRIKSMVALSMNNLIDELAKDGWE